MTVELTLRVQNASQKQTKIKELEQQSLQAERKCDSLQEIIAQTTRMLDEALDDHQKLCQATDELYQGVQIEFCRILYTSSVPQISSTRSENLSTQFIHSAAKSLKRNKSSSHSFLSFTKTKLPATLNPIEALEPELTDSESCRMERRKRRMDSGFDSSAGVHERRRCNL